MSRCRLTVRTWLDFSDNLNRVGRRSLRFSRAGLPVTFVAASFDQLRQVLDNLGVDRVDAVLADLGISSDQLDEAARGFSFQQDAPLDMRMNRSVGETAAGLLRRLSERDLADI